MIQSVRDIVYPEHNFPDIGIKADELAFKVMPKEDVSIVGHLRRAKQAMTGMTLEEQFVGYFGRLVEVVEWSNAFEKTQRGPQLGTSQISGLMVSKLNCGKGML